MVITFTEHKRLNFLSFLPILKFDLEQKHTNTNFYLAASTNRISKIHPNIFKINRKKVC
jgi:hypothetical protein